MQAGSSSTADAAPTTMLYCGQQYDSTLKMYNLRARFYDPSNGRFNVRDKFLGQTVDPQSLHKYLYANCDPANNIDPSGRFTLLEVLFVIAIIVVAAAFVGHNYALSDKAIRGNIRATELQEKLNKPEEVSSECENFIKGAKALKKLGDATELAEKMEKVSGALKPYLQILKIIDYVHESNTLFSDGKILNKMVAIRYAGENPDDIDKFVALALGEGRTWASISDPSEIDEVGVYLIGQGEAKDYYTFLVDLSKVIVDSAAYANY